MLLIGCWSNAYEQANNDDRERTRLLTLLGLAYLSNSCDGVASPTLESAMHTSPALTGYGYLKGKVKTQDGEPVVGGLVTLGLGITNTLYGSHTGINRDGTFIISGIPINNYYKLSISQVDDLYAGRIDTHLDCYSSPRYFTEGLYAGPDLPVTVTASEVKTIFLNSEMVDLGTFTINK